MILKSAIKRIKDPALFTKLLSVSRQWTCDQIPVESSNKQVSDTTLEFFEWSLSKLYLVGTQPTFTFSKRTMCKICSEITIKTPQRCQWCCSHIVVVFPSMILNKWMEDSYWENKWSLLLPYLAVGSVRGYFIKLVKLPYYHRLISNVSWVIKEWIKLLSKSSSNNKTLHHFIFCNQIFNDQQPSRKCPTHLLFALVHIYENH